MDVRSLWNGRIVILWGLGLRVAEFLYLIHHRYIPFVFVFYIPIGINIIYICIPTIQMINIDLISIRKMGKIYRMSIRRIEIAHQEIQKVRSRLSLRAWDAVDSDVDQRLSILGNLIDTDAGDELHRHVVVSSIAALQSFHRGTIVSIVDLGGVYKIRASELISEKLTLKDAIQWLDGNHVTFGELMSYSAPCNSVSDLLVWLGKLLSCDMKQALVDAVDPYDRRNAQANPCRIVTDIDALFANLSEAFRLRHIFAHEAALSTKLNVAECRVLHSSIVQWTNAIRAVLWDTAYQNFPLTQSEQNIATHNEVRLARDALAKTIRKARSHARATGSAAWFRRNHLAWMRVTKEWTCGAYGALQGTLWPAVGGVDLVRAFQIRAEQLMEWYISQNK